MKNEKISASYIIWAAFLENLVRLKHCDSLGHSSSLLTSKLHQTMLIPIPLALFYAGALIVLLLAFGKRDLQFGTAFFPIKRKRNKCVAFSLNTSN